MNTVTKDLQSTAEAAESKAEASEAAAATGLDTGLKAMETWMSMGAELYDFAAERFHENIRTQQRVLHCRSPLELQEIQIDFWQKAYSDYHNQAGRFVAMCQDLPGAAEILRS